MPPAPGLLTDLESQADTLRKMRHGVIEAVDSQFCCIRPRRLPKLVSLPEAVLVGRWTHAMRPGDRCLVYFDETASSPGYLALKYVISSKQTSYATIRAAAIALDRLAA